MRKMLLAAVAVLAVAAPAAANNNLVSNGSFESGLTGWSSFPNGTFEIRNTSQGFAAFHGSNYAVSLADEGYYLEQEISTQIGAFYVVSFRLASPVPGEQVGVFFGDGSGGTFSPSTGNSWNRYTNAFQAVSTASSLTLEFYNGSHDLYLDDVSVTALAPVGGVPEPASWAMLIAGFGLTGAAMRRRRSDIRAA